MGNLLERIAGPQAVAAGASVLFTGIAGHRYTIRNIELVSTALVPVTVKLGINGVADGDLLLPAAPIDAGGMAVFGGVFVLTGTDTLEADADQTGLTISIHGLDQS